MGWPFHLPGRVGTAAIILSSVGLFLFVAGRGRKWPDLGSSAFHFSLAIAVSDLIGWQTNVHDFSLLVLPLALIADYCFRRPPRPQGDNFALLYPAAPMLISPLWLVLWLAVGHMNLMAVPLLWWVWEIGRKLPVSSSNLKAD
jgi:hypothetical protein